MASRAGNINVQINDPFITINTRTILAPRRAESRFVSPNANSDSYPYFIICVLNTRLRRERTPR